jgi:hypothetical protein
MSSEIGAGAGRGSRGIKKALADATNLDLWGPALAPKLPPLQPAVAAVVPS